MIFRQLFDNTSSTYTYLLASRHGGEALIIDPVLERVDRYIQLLKELDLRLVKAIDTHLHADHITGLDALRERTHCITVMGEQTKAEVVSIRVAGARSTLVRKSTGSGYMTMKWAGWSRSMGSLGACGSQASRTDTDRTGTSWRLPRYR